MNTRPRGTRLPLHITISALFIGLVVLLGTVLSLQSYNRSSEMLLSGAEQVYRQIGNEVQLDFKATYRPAVRSLELIALSPIADAGTSAQRLDYLPLFTTTLKNGTSISALQIAYPNGDYFIARSLNNPDMRTRFNAPEQAHYVIDEVTGAGEQGRQLTRTFVDQALNSVRTEAPVPTDYDPRERDWYRQAGGVPRAIEPYLFYFIGKVGTTITLETARPGVVIAADIRLDQVSETIGRHRITQDSEVVLVDSKGRALAYPDSSKLVRQRAPEDFDIAPLSELGSPVLSHFAEHLNLQPRHFDFEFKDRDWTGRIDKIAPDSGLDLNIILMSPVDELLSEAVAIRHASLATTAMIILVAIPIVWLLASRISGSLRRLAAETDSIRRFDFDSPVTTRSFISEVDSLASGMRMMKTTITRFVSLINSLAGEKHFDALLNRITYETMNVGQADAAVAYLVDDDEICLQPSALQTTRDSDVGLDALSPVPLTNSQPLSDSLKQDQPGVVTFGPGDHPGLQPLLDLVEGDTLTLVSIPLRNRQNEPVGVLCLLYPDIGRESQRGERSAQIAFVRALSGFAAVSIESRHLLKMQEALLEAFIKLIASAIDAKSPYTGGHCQRVPELTRMLAEAACKSTAPPFADYRLSDEDWEALHIASWLHDCGKVTTPEYVVDKATKLETIYDRIHEIRMRFEVLKRDAEIDFWKQLSEGGERTALESELQGKLAALDEDFAFVAECNQGGEFMAPERLERLRRIAEMTWTRTLDDRLGISWEERQRKQRTPASPLPVKERLIADKPEHLIERSDSDRMPADNPWGFKLDVPEYKYNRGELYNLEVARGTLSEEERYKINDHMVQTIIMLDKLPYPKHLREVPAIAGAHHETMDGKGYPKRLLRDDMSLTARMMAIADIFEALTASDRPYKKAKTLSESLRILGFMKKDAHIDPDLFNLFLESGVWKTYAEKYLDPDQIDEVDIRQYLD